MDSQREEYDLNEMLNKIGKTVFVNFYYEFKDFAISDKELSQILLKKNPKSKTTKQSFRIPRARRIFIDGRQIEALYIIYNSERLDIDIRMKALEILKKEKSDDAVDLSPVLHTPKSQRKVQQKNSEHASDYFNLKEHSDVQIVELYSTVVQELKERGIIRTKNVLGDLGEYLAISYYNSTPGLPNLQAAPIGTRNIDAISRDGDRYSIKSTSTSQTGIFSGLDFDENGIPLKQYFEYVIVCRFNECYQLQSIYQIDWSVFVKHKKYHKTMRGWNLSITKELLSEAKEIFHS